MSNTENLTILIPLHGALQWLDVISQNIEYAPCDCKIIISDRTRVDTGLDHLIDRHKNDSRITFLDIPGNCGWREHINWLLKKVRSDFFCILPQDDSVAPDYFQKLTIALISHPSAVLAFAPILAYNYENQDTPTRFPSLPFKTCVESPWREAYKLENTWNLGIAFRGVIRTSLAQSILPTRNDMQADIIWIFGIALKGHLIEVPDALYYKRYHPESAHVGWHPLTPTQRYWYIAREFIRYCWYQIVKKKNYYHSKLK